MSREILFRGKYKISGKWVYGDLAHHDQGSVFIRYWHCGTYTSYEIDPETVCQYTGLTDKNGRKIFEGDIVNCAEYECCGNISWNESEAGFYFCVLLEGGGFEEENLYDYVDELEVIGNIFDNPELLEGGAE